MYVKVTSQRGTGTRKTYRELSKLTYSPEIDVTCVTMPVSEMSVTILTRDRIDVGSIIELFDDTDHKWCSMPVIYAELEDPEHVTVRGMSVLARLDSCELPAYMCRNEFVGYVIDRIMSAMYRETGVRWPVHVTEDMYVKRINGYFPKQSARARMQWILLVTGSTVADWHMERDTQYDINVGKTTNEEITDYIYIHPIDDEVEHLIPIESTYWRPKITYRDYVTAIKVTSYEYEHRLPSRTEEYIEIKADETSRATGDIWTQTSAVATLVNTAAPNGIMENVVEIDNVTIINDDNVDEVMTHLAKYHFTRNQVDIAAINNFDWLPADRIIGYLNAHELFTGYLNSCVFTFGKQAKAQMVLTPAEAREGAEVIVRYVWNGMTVKERTYTLPVGYEWVMRTEYVEVEHLGHYYVLMPTIEQYNVPIASGGTTLTIPMEVALDRYDDHVYVRSVDQANSSGTNTSLTGGRRS